MTRRIEQINDGSDYNPGDDMEDNPNFDDPENYEDDISEQGKSTYLCYLQILFEYLIFLNRSYGRLNINQAKGDRWCGIYPGCGWCASSWY